LTRELRRDLGPDLLTRGELDGEAQVGDLDIHALLGTQPHLDPFVLAIEERNAASPPSSLTRGGCGR
jgi:hypothetical protein